jgi:PAS domain S-box-containing protein
MGPAKRRQTQMRRTSAKPRKRPSPSRPSLLEALIRGTANATGETFFRRLVDELAANLNIRLACVGRLIDPTHIRVIASSEHSSSLEGLIESTSASPCAQILGEGNPLFCPMHARKRYPGAPMLQEFKIESLVGVPLSSSTGSGLGVILLMDDKPWKGRDALLSPLSLIASRAAAELERIEIEDQALESDFRLRAIIDAAPFGAHLYGLEDDGRLVFIAGNRSADRILGIRHHTLIGQTIEEAFPGLALQGIPDAYRNVARTGEPFETDLINYAHGEISGVFEVHVFQTSKDNVCAFFRDITERRKAELREEEASRVKTTLLRNISHEFRTPITGILGLASLLRADATDSAVHDKLDGITASATRLHTTLDAILKLAQLTSGEMRPQIGPVDPERISAFVREHFAATATSKGLSLEVFARLPEHAILGDEAFVLEIVGCLVDNGLKYTQSGGVTVRIVRTEHNGVQRGAISVQDTGIGIAAEHHIAIFEEFKQVSEGYGREFEGNGLGLAIARRMVGMLNGSIELVSNPGTGSTFTVTLPLTAIVAKPAVPVEPPRLPASHDQKPRVLIVEDNFINEMVMQNFLAETCVTDHARNAHVAIDMARKTGYDAIVMDINLGAGMNGIEATQEIRKIPGYQQTPIVAVTGYTLAGDKERILSQGLTHYLPKPFDRREIVEVVSLALSTRQ